MPQLYVQSTILIWTITWMQWDQNIKLIVAYKFWHCITVNISWFVETVYMYNLASLKLETKFAMSKICLAKIMTRGTKDKEIIVQANVCYSFIHKHIIPDYLKSIKYWSHYAYLSYVDIHYIYQQIQIQEGHNKVSLHSNTYNSLTKRSIKSLYKTTSWSHFHNHLLYNYNV